MRPDTSICRVSSRMVLAGLIVSLGSMIAVPAKAAIPERISYQGRLADAAGEPLPGSHSLVFRIYGSEEGGSALWVEIDDVVADSNGVFSVVLGKGVPIAVSFDQPRWLEIEADGEVLSPRREIVAVPSALDAASAANADSLGGLAPGYYSPAAHDHDSRYFTESELTSGGTVNTPSNPVDWTRLKNVPAGLADGTDAVGPGDGYSLDAADGSPVDAVFVNNSGSVGVGTNAPFTNLHVRAGSSGVGSADANADLVVEDDQAAVINFLAPDPYGEGLIFGRAGDTAAGWLVYDNPSDKLRLATAGTNRLTIDNLGRVGIGLLSPTRNLHIQQDVNGLVGLTIDNPNTGSTSSEALLFKDENGEVAAIRTYDDGSAYPNGMVIYNNRTNGYIGFNTDGIERMRIGDDGWIEVGTTDPSAHLRVEGSRFVYDIFTAMNTHVGGTGGVGAGNNEVYYVPSEGCGLAGTGYKFGLFGRANWTGNHAQAAVFGEIAEGLDRAYLCYRSSGGTQYKVYGDGAAATVMNTSSGRVTLICPESPEAWFEDYGSGEIAGGSCYVELDPLFLECITVDAENPLKVFVQLTSPLEQQYYVKKGETGFDVVVVGTGAEEASATFDYKVIGKWKGYEKVRFEAADPAPETVAASQAGD